MAEAPNAVVDLSKDSPEEATETHQPLYPSYIIYTYIWIALWLCLSCLLIIPFRQWLKKRYGKVQTRLIIWIIAFLPLAWIFYGWGYDIAVRETALRKEWNPVMAEFTEVSTSEDGEARAEYEYISPATGEARVASTPLDEGTYPHELKIWVSSKDDLGYYTKNPERFWDAKLPWEPWVMVDVALFLAVILTVLIEWIGWQGEMSKKARREMLARRATTSA